VPEEAEVFIPDGEDAAVAPAAAAVDTTHYLYIYGGVSNPDDLIALLRYVQEKRPAVGRDRWGAFEAERVTIIGGATDALELAEFIRALASADIEVEHLSANIAVHLR
jgi:hypothetical protein